MKFVKVQSIFPLILNFAIIVVFLLIANHSRLKYVQDEFIDDAVEYVNLSFFLADKNVFSEDGETLTYKREPLPSFLQSVYLQIFFPSLIKGGQDHVLKGPSNVLKVNGINLIYFFAICLAMWWLGLILFKSHLWAMFSILPSAMYLAFYANYLITINSEILAILLIILFTGTFLKYFETKNWMWGVSSGVFMGLLTLTKAVFFYLAPIFIIITFILSLLWKRQHVKNVIQSLIVLSLSYCLVILPWMIRNHFQFNDLSISKGGGVVLLNRAFMNQMTDEEYIGGYYAYGPEAFNDLFMGKLLGFNQEDLLYGGKLQRLNRGLVEDLQALKENRTEEFVSYFFIINNQLIPKLSKVANEGGISPESVFKAKAYKIINEDFLNHLKMSLLFFWRGIWIYKGQHLIVALANLALFASVFIIFFKGLKQKDITSISLTLLAILYILFHSLLTHYIPRYSVILLPILSFLLVFFVRKSSTSLLNKLALKSVKNLL